MTTGRPVRSARFRLQRGAGQRGSAAVLGVVLIGVLLIAALLAVAVGGVVSDQRRVESAADLSALAAAAALQRGAEPCPAAAVVAGRNGARLGSCTVDGDTVLVRVERDTRRILGRVLTVHSAARAGPTGALR